MPPRNTLSYTSRKRSKSLPYKSKQLILHGSRSNTSYKQQMRMVSFNSKKIQQDSKSQTDIPAVQRVLNEFEHILKNLQMTNSDISDLNILMKELKDCISHFPRFLSVNPEQKDTFFKLWDNLKNAAIDKLNSGEPYSYQNASKELHKTKENLEKTLTESQYKQASSVMTDLLKNFDNIQINIDGLIQNKRNGTYGQKQLHEQVTKIKTDLLKLQSSAPTTISNQGIARVILEFNKVEKKEKSMQILNFNIQKTEKQLQALIQIKPQTGLSSTRRDDQALSTTSSRKKRSKSVGPFDAKSRISRTSKLSSMSLMSKQLNDFDRKIGVSKSQSLNLNHEINSLNIKINRIQKSIANYQAQLDEIIEANSIERDNYKRKISDKIKKSGVSGCDTYDQKEKYLALERKNNTEFKQKLKEIESEEHERLDLNHKIHENENWQTEIDEELKRAQNLHDCLLKLTSEGNLVSQNANTNGAMEVKFDNDGLQEETEIIKSKISKAQKSINDWHESWRKSVGINLISNLESVPQNDIELMFKRSEFDHQYITNWSKELDSQINQLEKEANLLKQSTKNIDDDGLIKLKKAVAKLNFYSNPSPEIKSLPITQQIQINKIEINRLTKSQNEAKSESQEIEDQRNQNRQMIEWVKEIMDQIQSAMTSQSGLKAQLDKSMKTINIDTENDEILRRMDAGIDKNERISQEINELSDAIYSRDKIKSEYEDNNTNMQQLYENIFYVQTNQNFMQLCPQVKERIQKLIEYHRLQAEYNRLLNPDAQPDYSDAYYEDEYEEDNNSVANENADYGDPNNYYSYNYNEPASENVANVF